MPVEQILAVAQPLLAMMPQSVITGFWGGIFAAALCIVFSAPARAMPAAFCGGFLARFARDALMAEGFRLELGTLVGAALAAIVGALLIRRKGETPVVIASAVIPLAPGAIFIRAINDFLQITLRSDDKLAGIPAELVVNLSKVFTTTAAIAVGLSLTLMALEAVRRRPLE